MIKGESKYTLVQVVRSMEVSCLGTLTIDKINQKLIYVYAFYEVLTKHI